MKRVKLGMVCGALLLAACGGEDGTTGATGPAGAPGPAGPAGSSGGGDGGAQAASVNGVTPARSFPGRTVRMSISGDNTNWSTAPTVVFNDTNITASNITVASPTSIVLEVSIGENATIGDKTITVDGKAITGFQVQPALDAAFLGSPDQGALLFAALRNRDVENPFSSTSEIVSDNAAVSAQSSDPAETNLVQPNVFIDVDATGTANIGVVDQFTEVASYGAAPLTIKARAATPLAADETTAAIGVDFASSLYSYQANGGANGGLVSFAVEAGAGAPGGSNLLAVALTASGKWADGFSVLSATGTPRLARPGATSTGYILLLDNTGSGGYSANITRTVTSFGGKETEVNDTAAAANAITAAQVVFAELPTETDEDWFRITVPVNNRLTVTTTGLETVTVDTTIAIYGAGDTDTPIISSPDTSGNETVTTAALPAGTYLMRVATSEGFYNAAISAYSITATLVPPPVL